MGPMGGGPAGEGARVRGEVEGEGEIWGEGE